MRVAFVILCLLSLSACQRPAPSQQAGDAAGDATTVTSPNAAEIYVPQSDTISSASPSNVDPGFELATSDDTADPRTSSQIDSVATGIMQRPIYKFAAKTVAYSPNGKLIATGTGEGKVHLYATDSGELLRTIPAHDNWAFDVIFSADSKRLYSGGGDNMTKVWDVETGKLLHGYTDHTEDVHGVALADDENLIITGADDTQVLIRRVSDNTSEQLGKHQKQVTSVTVSPDGKTAASSSRDATVKIWDVAKRKELHSLVGHTKDIICVNFSHDSKQIVSASNDGTVRIWDVETGQQLKQINVESRVHVAIFTPNDREVIFGTETGAVKRFQPETESYINAYEYSADIADLAFSPEGQELAIVTANGDLIRIQEKRIALPREPLKQ